jgi:hypothetical protein
MLFGIPDIVREFGQKLEGGKSGCQEGGEKQQGREK